RAPDLRCPAHLLQNCNTTAIHQWRAGAGSSLCSLHDLGTIFPSDVVLVPGLLQSLIVPPSTRSASSAGLSHTAGVVGKIDFSLFPLNLWLAGLDSSHLCTTPAAGPPIRRGARRE